MTSDYVPSETLQLVANRFLSWSENLLLARNWATERVLFHYTSVDSFEQILASEKLWLTRLQQQKDPVELKFGLDLFRRVVDENMSAASESRLHNIFFTELLRLDEGLLSTHFDCHIACFAPHGENFDLWETYGHNGKGVAIGLTPQFFKVNPPEPGEPLWAVQPVTYGAFPPLHQFKKLLQIVTIALGEAAPFVTDKDDARYITEVMQNDLVAGHVIPICMLAKGDLYHQETEIRVLAPRTRTNGEPRLHHITVPFRPGIIDHVRVGENADRERIDAIVKPLGIKLETAIYSRGLSR
ncbi:hypothetical protein [Rhizobium rhizogenes]|uniref:hypothetical protein n=1 Tax=Rhizobium rhizogenes TaxID=359 RepID=UPI001572C9A2|nr:hypothetical protein [Rhizobium rhizogenes]NTG08846.1 hypothetical protein [Rhizobium rhizogenes]